MHFWYRTNVHKYLIFFVLYMQDSSLTAVQCVYMKDQFNTNASQPKTRKESRVELQSFLPT